MEDGVTIREIALWTLTKHRDAVGDHLDLSDEALQSLFQRVEVDNTLRDHGVYHVSVTVTYGDFVFAANEEEAETKALDMDLADMTINDDVSVDVELMDRRLRVAEDSALYKWLSRHTEFKEVAP